MALILWDYDGVLVNTIEIEDKYFTAACREVGIEQIHTCEDLIKLSQGNFYEECIKLGIDIEKMEAAIHIFEKRIKELNCQIPIFQGVPEIMVDTARWFPSYIITSNTETLVAEKLKKEHILGIREILGYEFEKSKVKKIEYVKALYPGEKIYFIGDTSGDILEAKASGVDVTIGVSWGWHTVEVLSQANPDYIFNEVSQLRDFLYSLFERPNE